MELLTSSEQDRMRAAGRATAATLDHVAARLAPGVSTLDIDQWVRDFTQQVGGRPCQLGYHGFPATCCTSVNAVVCHGIPSSSVVLREGDIVNVDVTTELNGYCGDSSRTFVIGTATAERRRLVRATERALHAGIAEVGPGKRLGDIGAAILEVAEAEGYTVVRSYCGHGIGKKMHLPPQVSHVGRRGRGLRLRPGMAFTIEPMLNAGTDLTVEDPDGWTVRTADGKDSAQFEHTILVTEQGHEILTRS